MGNTFKVAHYFYLWVCKERENVITQRQYCHHPAPILSSPGANIVITRLVRVIQNNNQET
jgi:hypothetical protein